MHIILYYWCVCVYIYIIKYMCVHEILSGNNAFIEFQLYCVKFSSKIH